jgi:hypothetical protein
MLIFVGFSFDSLIFSPEIKGECVLIILLTSISFLFSTPLVPVVIEGLELSSY